MARKFIYRMRILRRAFENTPYLYQKINEDIDNLSLNTCISSFYDLRQWIAQNIMHNNKLILCFKPPIGSFAIYYGGDPCHPWRWRISTSHQTYPTTQWFISYRRQRFISVCINGKKRYEWTVAIDKPQLELEKVLLLKKFKNGSRSNG